jgi:hypothetical protein
MATQEILPPGTDNLAILLEYNANSLLMIARSFWPVMASSLLLAIIASLIIFVCCRSRPRRDDTYSREERPSRSRSRSRY